MNNQDYQSSIITSSSPHNAYDKICRVSEWWASNFEGISAKLEDVFTVSFPNGDWYQMRISELIQGKKNVWNVIGSDQTWHDDRDEWTGTTIVWEISPEKDGSKITMTHVGLLPTSECYEKCKMGWDYLMQKSLSKFLTENQGMPV